MKAEFDKFVNSINAIIGDYGNCVSENSKKIEQLVQENKKLKVKLKEADERCKSIESKVKSHLSYRLGNLIVRKSHSLSGVISIPFYMYKEYKNWKSDKSSPLISVIIPCYNCEKYIEKCVYSVLNQSIKDIEIICVDDGSNDNTVGILKEIRKKDSRVIIIEQNNQHAGVARNNGLARATGMFVHFLDGDDWVGRNIYEKTLNIATKTSCDVVMFSYENFDNSNGNTFKSKYFDTFKKEMINQVISPKSYSESIMRAAVVPWNKIYRKSFLINNNLSFDDLTIANDRSFYFKMLYCNPKMVIIRDSLIFYRTNNKSSLVGNSRIVHYDCHFKSFDKIKDLYLGTKEYHTLLDLFLIDLRLFYEKANVDQRKKIKNDINTYINSNKRYFECIDKLVDKKSYYFYKMIMNDKCIPVVFSVDDNYVKYLSVALVSMIKNSSPSYKYDIVILYTDLSEENKKKIKSLSCENCTIEFHNVTYKVKHHNLYNRAHYSISMYYRILIPEIFANFKKVLYLDCDIIVIDDISKLFFTSIKSAWIGACINYVNNDMRRYTNYKFNIDYPYYFNSGVLIINNEMWKNNNVAEKCFEYLSRVKDLVCPDQDALNVVCRNNVEYLDDKWNFAWQHIVLDSAISIEQKRKIDKIIENDKSIIHFTSGVKPWKLSEEEWKNDYGKLWWSYAKHSPYYHVMVEDLKHFKAKNNFILSEKA